MKRNLIGVRPLPDVPWQFSPAGVSSGVLITAGGQVIGGGHLRSPKVKVGDEPAPPDRMERRWSISDLSSSDWALLVGQSDKSAVQVHHCDPLVVDAVRELLNRVYSVSNEAVDWERARYEGLADLSVLVVRSLRGDGVAK